jgi:uncharacterized delta-60 repeat protein
MKEALMNSNLQRIVLMVLFTTACIAQDGGLDITFNGSGIVTTAISANSDGANCSAVQSDGKIVIAGYASNGSDYDFAIARYNTNGTIDNTFSGTGKIILAVGSGYDEARGVAIQSDGKIIVAGYSSNGSNNDITVVRFNSNGTLDNSFDGDGIVTTDIGSNDNEVYAVTIQSDGKIVVVGYTYNGSNSDFAVLRYNSDGTLDDTFDGDGIVTTAIGSGSDEAKSIAIQSDGKIVVAGYSHNGADGDAAVVRYNVNGTLDNTFGASGIVVTDINAKYEEAYTIAIQTDGKIVVAGYTDTESNAYDAFLLRYTTSGVLDNTFDSDGKVITTLSSYDDPIRSIAIQSDGKIVAAGSTTVGSDGVIAVQRYNSNGTLDNTFGTNGIVTTLVNQDGNDANSVFIQSNGKIVIAGYTTNAGNTDVALVRYIGDAGPGDLDITLNGSGKVKTTIGSGSSGIRSLALQPDGKIVAAGHGSNGANSDFALARYSSAGALDNTFNTTGKVLTAVGASSDEANGVAVQADGKIVAVGYSWNGSNSDFAVIRYNSNGSLDNSFSGDGIVTTDINSQSNEAYGVAIQPDGKIVVVGYSSNGSNNDFAVVRYNTDGTLDNSFSGDGIVTTDVGANNDEAKSIVIQPNGKIVVGGLLHNGDDGDAAIARYNSDGTLDTSFDTDGKAVLDIAGDYEEVNGIALQSDGKILATGYTSNGSNYDIFVLRYTTAGALDNSFDTDGKVITSLSSYDDLGQSIAVQSDGKFIVIGYSSNGNDQEIVVLRYLNTGALDNAFGTNGVIITGYQSGQNEYAAALAIQPNSNIVVAGTGNDGSNDNFMLFRFVGDAGPLVTLSYSGSTFSESESNTGSIDNSAPVTFMLSGDTFTGSDNDNFASAGKVTVSNLPSGLTAVVTRTSSTTLSVTLTGNASSHVTANSLSNLTFTFQNSAFTGGNASAVVNYAKNDLQISFQDPFSAHTISFDGVDDYVNIPLATSPTVYTVEMWVKPASTSDAVIFERTNDGGPETAFSHELDIKDGKFQHYLFDGNSWSVLGVTTVVANTWYHVAITAANNGMMRLYVNGVEEGTAVSIGTLWTEGNRYVLNGYRTSPGLIQYTGLIDEVRIWNSQRSQAQISGSMNSQLVGNESGLLAYWNCDEGTGTTMYDQTSNSYTATMVNGVSWSLPSGNLAYSGTTFAEAGANNGTIDNSSPKTVTLYGPVTFSGSNSDDFVAGGKITVSGIPSGLTAVATRTSSTTLSLTLTGTAPNHSAVNSVSNLGFTFGSGAFVPSIDSTTVGGYNKSDLSVSFNDPSATLLGGNTLVLDGTGDYVLSSNTLGNFGSGDFTIELWVKTTVPGRNILGKRFSGSHGSFFVLAMDGSGKPGLELDEDDNGTNYSATSATTSVSDGNWHHIACTRNGTTITYYLDGVQDGQTTADVASISNSTEFSIGTRYADGYGYGGFFNGSIDDVRLWNVARSQAQIAANKDSYISSTTSGLIGNFRFDESSGSTTAEIVNRSANAGTLYGDAQFSNTPLPVELVSFTADTKQNGIELRWKTATEVNNHGFEIQRSEARGQMSENNSHSQSNEESRTWTKAGFVEGNGTSNIEQEYSFIDRSMSAGKYSYRLKQIDRDGKFEYSAAIEVMVGAAPMKFELSQNYPNPFNPSTNIEFTVPATGRAVLKVYNIMGQEVATLFDGIAEAGVFHQYVFDASRFSSGVYFARLTSNNKFQIQRMMLLR